MRPMASVAEPDRLDSARGHLERAKAQRARMERHGKAVVEHLRRYAELRRQAARSGR